VRKPSIDPVVWDPPVPTVRAGQASGPEPFPPMRLIPLPGAGPEDVAVAPDGTGYTGLADGRVLRVDPPDDRVEVVAHTGGRPLGVEWRPDGRLVVCDAHRGLLEVDPRTGRVLPLVTEVAGIPLRCTNNAAVAMDGTVYFSDSSRRFGLDHWLGDILEHSGTGRLLCRRPDGGVDVLLDGLQFANGVALAADESFVAVAETGSYLIRRRWLTGPRAGTDDVLVANLPGIPDNISLGVDGLIWVALASARDPRLDLMHRRTPLLRKAVWALPEPLRPKPRRTAWVQAYAPDGRLVRDLQTSDGRLGMVTGVRVVEGAIWLGSLTDTSVGLLTV
jgi:sugar lactone lactonase YvrE